MTRLPLALAGYQKLLSDPQSPWARQPWNLYLDTQRRA